MTLTYYQKHREKMLAYQKAYLHKHKDKHSRYMRAYYAKNKEVLLARRREKREVMKAKYRALGLNTSGKPYMVRVGRPRRENIDQLRGRIREKLGMDLEKLRAILS